MKTKISRYDQGASYIEWCVQGRRLTCAVGRRAQSASLMQMSWDAKRGLEGLVALFTYKGAEMSNGVQTIRVEIDKHGLPSLVYRGSRHDPQAMTCVFLLSRSELTTTRRAAERALAELAAPPSKLEAGSLTRWPNPLIRGV